MTDQLMRMRRRRLLKARLRGLEHDLARISQQLQRLNPPPLRKATWPRMLRVSGRDGRAQIREARLQLGWTQERLADAAGLTRGTVSHLEGGRSVTVETMRRVLQALRDFGLDVDEEASVTLPRCDDDP